tara:strand:+ start:450 stop:1433 length:984 start_codon:yes stop_codon:yes gene_type:complete
MATFQAQVTGLTKITISSSGTSPTEAQLTQFLTDGAKEIITALPIAKKVLYSTSNALDNSTTNLTLGGSEVLGVMRDDGTINQPCRRIPSTMSGRSQDSAEMTFGTASDPVWWVVNNILSIFPEPSSSGATVQTLAYPAVAYSDSAITKFPDEAEYLVSLYASIKTLQNTMGDFLSNDSIDHASTGALALINTALDRIASYNWGDSDTFTAGSAQLTRVKNALDQASDIINGNAPSTSTDAFGAQSSEDIELTGSALSIAATELNRAQQHLSEWSAISGVASSEAQGFIAEAQARIARDNQKYQWYQGQQAKLQADYDKGLQIIMAS